MAIAESILAVLVAMTLVMTASWAVQRTLGDASWTDVFWTFGSGACLTATAIAGGEGWRRWLVAAMVALWSARLGSHLARRVVKGPEDARYAQFRRELGAAFQRRMLGLSLAQAPATAVLGLGVALAARAPGERIGPSDILGAALFLAACLGEAVADSQLRAFKADCSRKSQVCDFGLWAWSRHPNYFFEALLWWAFPAIALRPDDPLSLISLATPALMFLLLRFGSGVPPLEQAMLRSRQEAYRLYQARVSPFFPLPPRKVPR